MNSFGFFCFYSYAGGCRSVVQCVPSMSEDLGSILSLKQTNKSTHPTNFAGDGGVLL